METITLSQKLNSKPVRTKYDGNEAWSLHFLLLSELSPCSCCYEIPLTATAISWKLNPNHNSPAYFHSLCHILSISMHFRQPSKPAVHILEYPPPVGTPASRVTTSVGASTQTPGAPCNSLISATHTVAKQQHQQQQQQQGWRLDIKKHKTLQPLADCLKNIEQARRKIKRKYCLRQWNARLVPGKLEPLNNTNSSGLGPGVGRGTPAPSKADF